MKEELSTCPKCEFPAILSEFSTLLGSEETCPMCSERVSAQNLQTTQDTARILNPEEGED